MERELKRVNKKERVTDTFVLKMLDSFFLGVSVTQNKSIYYLQVTCWSLQTFQFQLSYNTYISSYFLLN